MRAESRSRQVTIETCDACMSRSATMALVYQKRTRASFSRPLANLKTRKTSGSIARGLG